MYMPVMDHKTVGSMKVGDEGFVVNRAVVVEGRRIATLNRSAHLYPTTGLGQEVAIRRNKENYSLLVPDRKDDQVIYNYYTFFDIESPS